jgi:hypothetical protein
MTKQSTDTYVSLDTQQVYSTSNGHQNGFNTNGYTVTSNDTASGNGTVTGSDTTTEQSQSSMSVYQAGSFSNDSYGLSSYSFSAQGSDTLTSTSSDTFTWLLSGPDSGQETISGPLVINGSGTFTETLTGGDSSGSTQTDSWSLTELGSVSAGQLALSCYALSAQVNSSASSADSSTCTETDSGYAGTYISNNNVYTYSYSGSANHSASVNQNSTSSASLLEQGVYNNGSFNLSLVSYSGSGNESGSASDGDSGTWSGTSFSSTASDSAQSGDSGSYSMSASGNYSNGSFSLSNYVLQGSSTQSWSQQANETDVEKGPPVFGNAAWGANPNFGTSTNHTFSRSDNESAVESGSLYQTGSVSAGSYSNLSYSNTESSVATVSNQAFNSQYCSSDSWQTSGTQTMTLSAGSSAGSSAYSFSEGNTSGSATNSVSSTLTVTTPALLVDFLTPDASSVGIVSADASGGGAPVSTPDVGVTRVVKEWLSGTNASAQEATQPESAMPMVPPGAAKGPLGDPESWWQRMERKLDDTVGAALGNAYNNSANVAGTVEAVDKLARAPIEAAKAVAHPVQTAQAIGNRVAQGYDTARAGGESKLGSAVLGGLLPVADAVGVTNLNEAHARKELITNRDLSDAEVVEKRIVGGVQVATTAGGVSKIPTTVQAVKAIPKVVKSAPQAIKKALGREAPTPAAAKKVSCFTAGTPVATNEGLRPIETIRPDDLVWAFDLVKSEWRLCRATEPYSIPYNGTLVLVTIAGETTEATYRHPYWVVRGEDLSSRPWLTHLAEIPKDATTAGRWVDSCDLRVGDEVLLRDGRMVPVEGIGHRLFEGPVYNMEVEELQCYTVGRNSVLVHNQNSPVTGPEGEGSVAGTPKQGELFPEEVKPTAPSNKGSNNPNTQEAALKGTQLHLDKPGNLPDQLRKQYPDTEFKFKSQGELGQDVEVIGGKHPSEYPGSNWPEGVNHGDFKPDTPGGRKTFNSDQKNKWTEPTEMLPYDPNTGELK